MSRPPDPAPVFVVGAPGSGTRLLAWALAEHPRFVIAPVEGWMGRLAASLGPLARQASAGGGTRPSCPDPGAISPGRLAGAVGKAVSDVLRETGDARWVDGTPENALRMWGISRLLPNARFIHLVRGIDEVAHHLISSPTPRATYYTPDTATEAWLRYVDASLRAEAALGGAVVHRVLHRDLARDPRRGIEECLKFLGETWCEACVRPLRGMVPEQKSYAHLRPAGGVGTHSRLRGRAVALTAGLLADPPEGRPKGGSRDPVGPLAIRPGEARRFLDETFLQGALEEEDGGRAGSPVHRIGALIRLGVPEGATVAVVSRGDEDLVRIPRRHAWHYPQSDGGVYAGHHPGDSDEAVAHLEALRARGAEYLFIPCTAYWWLDHYDGLRRHLDTRARLVAFQQDTGFLFALSREGVDRQPRVALTDGSPGTSAPQHGSTCSTQEEFR